MRHRSFEFRGDVRIGDAVTDIRNQEREGVTRTHVAETMAGLATESQCPLCVKLPLTSCSFELVGGVMVVRSWTSTGGSSTL